MSENVPDPLIEFLNKLNFDNVPLFEELHQQQFDKDLCFKYYKLSTEVALFHILNTFETFDTHPSNVHDHIAMRNMIKWMMFKFISDPVWFSYLGWFFWAITSYGNVDSYHPLTWHPKFCPDNFHNRDEHDVEDITKESVRPHEVFKIDIDKYKRDMGKDEGVWTEK